MSGLNIVLTQAVFESQRNWAEFRTALEILVRFNIGRIAILLPKEFITSCKLKLSFDYFCFNFHFLIPNFASWGRTVLLVSCGLLPRDIDTMLQKVDSVNNQKQ